MKIDLKFCTIFKKEFNSISNHGIISQVEIGFGHN